MAKLIIATLLSLLLAQASAQGTNIDEGCPGTGQSTCIANALCTVVDSAPVCRCATGFTATTDKTACSANIDTVCTGSGQGDCIADALCTPLDSGSVCKCATGFTATTEKTACKNSVGQTCIQDADCITSKCQSTCRYNAGDTGCLTDDMCMSGTACTDVSSVKKCTTLIDGACTGTDQSTCPAEATCTSLVCKCNTGYTANTARSTCRYNAGDTGCLTDDMCMSGTACTDVSSVKKCTTLIDGACTGTDQSTCPAEATCTSLVCKCNTGYTANTARSTCGKNGAAGVTASLVLMAAAFVASRFF